jgi:hypothetical protein
MKEQLKLAVIRVNEKELKCMYDCKKRKAYMLDKSGEPDLRFCYSNFKLLNFIEKN